MQDPRKLRVWHLGHEVSDRVYEVTDRFPTTLKDQLRDAADSKSSNISEGCGRATPKEKAQFFHISLGSINEVDNRLFRARRAGFVTEAVYMPLKEQVVDARKMLVSLIKKVRAGGERQT